jgi:hypothetical protein
VGFVFACGYCQAPLKGPADPNPDCMFKSPPAGKESIRQREADRRRVSQGERA